MEKTSTTFTCDRCGTKGQPTGIPRYPMDWAKIEIKTPWGRAHAEYRLDFCKGCAGDFQTFIKLLPVQSKPPLAESRPA